VPFTTIDRIAETSVGIGKGVVHLATTSRIGRGAPVSDKNGEEEEGE